MTDHTGTSGSTAGGTAGSTAGSSAGSESRAGDEVRRELLELTQQLLDSITAGDWETYTKLCDPTLTAFEPEARGQLVRGLDFHRYYFEAAASAGATVVNTTIAAPFVRLLGEDTAIVCYVRLIQQRADNGGAETLAFEETRVWRRQDNRWRHVHFHRSAYA